MLDGAFAELGPRQVTSGTAEANVPSCLLLARLAFRHVGEGTLSFRRTPEGKPIGFRGLPFALTREEWTGPV